MQELMVFLWSIAGVALAIAFTGAAISIATHRRMVALGQLDPETLRAIRHNLVAVVGDASTEKRARIDIAAFMKGLGLTKPQQYVVLQELFEKKILHETFSTDSNEAFVQWLLQRVFNRPARWVQLNSRDWSRLATAPQAQVVIREISGGIVQVGDHNVATLSNELTASKLRDLVAALREDSRRLSAEESEIAESLADTIERDSQKGRGRMVAETVKTIASFAASGASVWASTVKVLFG